ncbi:MAG: nicotinate-nucleotide--dimethylbenzimidazole phosphoribosyltransferase [Chloracidobacterium sp.]|uniref:Nicotinate-nucleotide--dimethylbenzimidazole phosphoribosyltransferase n=1 Tax=Chloracidobacterium validum TaxID=2821543 RepID=A0ABX8B980_9BACT|nr:nicotinate-nucleotide--dimethylbenzimidazole phosphoribosyltransferase [Chloracidobacterium validum]QUW02105.1 nicotinate-nucleotide--dimethylbenzimidazole phosphoribosyltransferase [Chloracidobacterium validum]
MPRLLQRFLNAIQPPDQAFAEQALARQAQLVKPPGSLGQLETVAAQMAAIQATPTPQTSPRTIVIFCADHGVCVEGISAFPASITHQHLRNFITGGAAIAILAELTGSQLLICDVGVDADLSDLPGIRHGKVQRGTRNFLVEPAMTTAEAEQAIRFGFETIGELAEQGQRVVAIGEMGIGNTTAAAAVTAALTQRPPEEVTGRGSGLSTTGVTHKVAVIRRALEHHRPNPNDPLDILVKVGGFDLAAMCGAFLGCAASRVAAVADGFVSTAAAALAAALAPMAREFMLFGHRSAEPGHQALLDVLQATPLLQLDMRLGEASGAALTFPILDAACRLHASMATFAEANLG